MKLRHLTSADYKRMPWKNGQGSTTELIASPGAEGGAFNWRLSIAEVGQSGPFSDFSGYDRFITLIEGAGMVLNFNGIMERRIDQPFQPLPFDGGWQTDCTLIDGPLRDFNLMVARNWGYSTITILRPAAGDECEIDVAPVTLLHVFAGSVSLQVDGIQHDLKCGDTLHLENAPDGWLRAGHASILAAIYLEPR
ncbi:MAG: HutD family protein [Rhodospirillaceae bacterium]|nr:MAG: HutD family protein [Rhodospirillaceae bacterium]